MSAIEITINFGDGEYLFALKLPQIIELEDKCAFTDAKGNRRRKGAVAIYGDLLEGIDVEDGQVVVLPGHGIASLYECREVVRLALIGGGGGQVDGSSVKVDPPKARALLEAYFDNQPAAMRWTLAAAIMRALIEGYDPPKKAEPAAEPAPRRTRKKAST